MQSSSSAAEDAADAVRTSHRPSSPLDIPAALSSLLPASLLAAVQFDSSYTQEIVAQTLKRRPFIRIINTPPLQPSSSSSSSSSPAATAELDSPSSPSSSRAHSRHQPKELALTLPADCPPSALHLQWTEFELIHWPTVLSPPPPPASSSPFAAALCIASSYCTRRGLNRKAHLCFLLRKYMSKRPSSLLCSHVPDSHVVSIDHPDYVEEALCELPELQQMHDSGLLYLLKASMIDRGRGLYLIRSVDDFEAAITAAGNEEVREWVLQQYVQRPLLQHGTKFHIRAYVLCTGNLSVLVFNRMLALFACRPYELQSDSLLSHLTNTCLAAEQPDFSAADCIRTLESLPLPASPHPCSLRSLHEQIVAILSELFTCLHSEPTAFQPLPAAFELFGFDFLCDDSGNVWLLEANAGPDFGQSGDEAGRQVIEQLMEQTARMTVDTAAAATAGGRSEAVNLARSAQEGVDSGYVQLDDGAWTDWSGAKRGHFRLCYSRLISHSVRMRYF